MQEDINKLLWKTLSNIEDLDSPQINVFGKKMYSNFPSFSFRFKSDNLLIYNRLIQLVGSFEGKLKWKMHNQGSRKNYTIEPELVMLARERVFEGDYSTLKEALMGDYVEIFEMAILDIPPLCERIRQVIMPSQ